MVTVIGLYLIICLPHHHKKEHGGFSMGATKRHNNGVGTTCMFTRPTYDAMDGRIVVWYKYEIYKYKK